MPTAVAPVVTAAPAAPAAVVAAVVAAVTAIPVVVPAVMAAAVMAVPTAEATHNRPMLPSTILFTVTFERVPFVLDFLCEITVPTVVFPTVVLVGVVASFDLFGVVGAADVVCSVEGATDVVCSNPVLFLRSTHGVVAIVDVAVVEASESVLSIIITNAI